MHAREIFRSRTFARDRRTWIVTLVAAVSLWAGSSAWLNRHVTLAERRPSAQGGDGRFVVLAYDRIVTKPDGRNLDRERLSEEIRRLASAGWQAVTLEEIRDAYRGALRLPAKPVLLTFDDGYLATYEAADPVLRELRWPAVMLLRTEREERRDVSFLFWDRLRRMTQSGLWEIASGDPVAIAPSPTGGQLPTIPPGAALIAERIGAASSAWAPRGVDPLTALTCAAAGERVWRERGAVPWLGFVDDVVGANAPDGNPFRIGRLRVDPRWDSAELLRRIDGAVLDAAAPGANDARGKTPWIAGEGASGVADGVARLDGHPRAEVWFPSARWLDDWSFDLHLYVDGGEFWVVQPGDAPGREWRFGGTNGVFYLEDRVPGRPPDVLARATVPWAIGQEHHLRMVKRGSGVSLVWDGRPVTNNPVALPERWRGKLGVIAYRADGPASLTITSAELSARPYGVRSVSPSPGAAEVAALAKDAESIAALSPPWATIEGDVIREGKLDRDLFRILARRYAWDILPVIAWKAGAPSGSASATWIAGLPERVTREGWAGVRVDRSAATESEAGVWSASARDLEAGLRRAQKRLIVAAP